MHASHKSWKGKAAQPVKTLLVIEDTEVIRDFLCDLLAAFGFSVTCCSDGPSALKVAESRDFDVVITDYDMPGMTGAEVTKHLRERSAASIIIGVSSDDRKEDFLSAGADAFLQKPYRHTDLLALINREMTYSLL